MPAGRRSERMSRIAARTSAEFAALTPAPNLGPNSRRRVRFGALVCTQIDQSIFTKIVNNCILFLDGHALAVIALGARRRRWSRDLEKWHQPMAIGDLKRRIHGRELGLDGVSNGMTNAKKQDEASRYATSTLHCLAK
jgi:hypothetical protein